MRSLLLAVLAAYLIAAIHSSGVRQQTALASARRAVVNGAGFVLHRDADRGLGARRAHPLFSLRETLSFLAWALVGGYAIVLYRYRAQAVGAFTMPLICVLTFVALLITGDSGTSVEAFSTTWLFPIHTTLLVFAYAAFFIVFMASVMPPERELKLKTFSAFFHRLPSLSTINEIATHAAAIGLTLLTLGLVAGMFWNWSLHGTMWRNDPKDLCGAYVAALLRARNLSFHRKLARTSSSVARRTRVRARALHFSGRAIARQLSRVRSGIDLTLMRSLNQCR